VSVCNAGRPFKRETDGRNEGEGREKRANGKTGCTTRKVYRSRRDDGAKFDTYIANIYIHPESMLRRLNIYIYIHRYTVYIYTELMIRRGEGAVYIKYVCVCVYELRIDFDLLPTCLSGHHLNSTCPTKIYRTYFSFLFTPEKIPADSCMHINGRLTAARSRNVHKQ